jgi:hypothetical protein
MVFAGRRLPPIVSRQAGAYGQHIIPSEEESQERMEPVRVDLPSAQESCNFPGILTRFLRRKSRNLR